MNSTGLNRVLPRKQITEPVNRNIANITHWLLSIHDQRPLTSATEHPTEL